MLRKGVNPLPGAALPPFPPPHPSPPAALLQALERLARQPLMRDGDGLTVRGLGALDVARAAALGPGLAEVLGTLTTLPAPAAMNLPACVKLRDHWLSGLWLELLTSLTPPSGRPSNLHPSRPPGTHDH